MKKMPTKRACVVVLGDIGRSPRMQNHALSLAKEGYIVDLVGYAGSQPQSALLLHPQIRLQHVKQAPDLSTYVPRVLNYALKVIIQSFFLLYCLIKVKSPNIILVQNPPSIPALPVCWFVAKCKSSKLIIDWHNYGHTILALSLHSRHPLVKICRWIELTYGRLASAGFCVTKAMQKDLETNWNIKTLVLYDRPAEQFQPNSWEDRHELFTRLSQKHKEFQGSRPGVTLFTELFADGRVQPREDRPGLLISSTSWTEDEDFSFLLQALDSYDSLKSLDPVTYPPLVCVITGKGPLKGYYQALIQEKEWQHVQVVTPWLEPDDYPRLLASADLGICLHTSSSGLDLPMKVVDMFGCQLPVCAYAFKCLDELVKHDENGLVFGSADELSQQIASWFHDFPRDCINNAKFRQNLHCYANLRWHPYWQTTALPLMEEAAALL